MTQHDFMEREGITNLTSSGSESFFSWNRCDCCQRLEGGDREPATGFNQIAGQIREYTICIDCVYFAEYGRLDDLTMLELAGNASHEFGRGQLETLGPTPSETNGQGP